MKRYKLINYTDCTESQQRDIFNLRNLPEIRKWMTNTGLIAWHDHLDFVESLKHTENRQYYAIYEKDELVGTYNLTKDSDTTWERGIIISPLFQGTGSTVEIERWVLGTLSRKEFRIITAKVKQDNLRSIRYHEKAGYVEKYRDTEYIYYHKTLL